MFVDIGRLMQAVGNFGWGQEPDLYTFQPATRVEPVEPAHHRPIPSVESETVDPARPPDITPRALKAAHGPVYVPPPPSPVDVLAQALEAAETDAERSRLLTGVSREVRDRLNNRLRYLRIMRSESPHATFERELAAALDDAARRTVIASRSAAFLNRWALWQRGDHTSKSQHYLNIMSAP